MNWQATVVTKLHGPLKMSIAVRIWVRLGKFPKPNSEFFPSWLAEQTDFFVGFDGGDSLFR